MTTTTSQRCCLKMSGRICRKFWPFCMPLFFLIIIQSFHPSLQSTSSTESFSSSNGKPVSSRRHSLVTSDHHLHPYLPASTGGLSGLSGSSLFNHFGRHNHHHFHPQPQMMMVAPMAASSLVPTQVYGGGGGAPYNLYSTPYYPTQTIYYHAPSSGSSPLHESAGHYHSSGHSTGGLPANPNLLGSIFGSSSYLGSPSSLAAPGLPPPLPAALASEPEVQHSFLLEDLPGSDADYGNAELNHPARFLSYGDSFSPDLFSSPSSSKVYRKKGSHKKGRSRQRQALYKDDYDDDYDPFSAKAKRRLKSSKHYSSSFETFDDDGDFDDTGFKRIDGVARSVQSCE